MEGTRGAEGVSMNLNLFEALSWNGVDEGTGAPKALWMTVVGRDGVETELQRGE